MITYKMHFLRCGRAAAGDWKGYLGRRGDSLSPEGAEELRELERNFLYPKVEMVFTSPLARAVESAELLYPEVYTVEADDLTDMDLGIFAGRSVEELRGDADFEAWLRNSAENPPPGGERMQDYTQRIIRGVETIFRRMMDERMRSVAVVTHGGVIMSLLAGICLPKRPMDQWAVGAGTGYTLLFTPQMWMRDGCAEVFAALPEMGADLPQNEPDGYV